MALLIMRKGKVVYNGDDWDQLENYAGGKPNEVCVWPFERSRCGKVTVDYSDGALAMFTGDSFINLCDYLRGLHDTAKWPKPRVFGTPLPRVGVVPGEDVPAAAATDEADPQALQETEPEPEPEPEPAPERQVRRSRTRVVEEPQNEPVSESRVRRSRAGNAERIRRVRAG